ncbi:hypothetical protein PIB30_041652 [Stylosanthes scabra]|uniref:Uncharacterized protein n=1 Tax=Stylosanthes scabra TaxID=79078 RepID=A0ABU6ZDS1_9FABA|nr:hypothetical protein [Stylosanthes scabra]
MLKKAQPLFTTKSCCIYKITVEEFVKVIFVDSCFVIELFLKDEWMINDVISSKPWIAFNQQGVLLPVASSIAHFTDLNRYFYLPPFHTRPSRNPELLVLGHSAAELVESGVKFIVNKSLSSSHVCMLDLEFKNGTLRIPHIKVGDGSEIWLKNIVAFEQCHYPQEHYILDYIIFLGQLMKTDNDAGVLIEARVIDCVFGGNYESKVPKLFGHVGKNTLVTSTNVDYLQLLHDLNAYYDHPWHNKMTILRRDYFSTPWMTAASIAGIMLLILLVIQTVCSVLQV